VNRLTSILLPTLNRQLAVHALPPLTRLFQLLDRCTRVLVMTSPSFDFRARSLPANVRYVGPQIDDPDWATASEAWRPEGEGPLVLVSLSSIFQHQLPVLRRIAVGLGQLPVRVVMTTGRAVDPAELQPPDNVRVLSAAPHRAVLAEAAAVVTHAGHGTVVKSLAAGVPMVCLPMGRDQRDNTARVLRLGAGVRVRAGARPEAFAGAVTQLLQQPSYRSAARHFAAVLADEARTRPTAADEAEGLLDRRPNMSAGSD
jgi:MGT family glycosyltransferase